MSFNSDVTNIVHRFKVNTKPREYLLREKSEKNVSYSRNSVKCCFKIYGRNYFSIFLFLTYYNFVNNYRNSYRNKTIKRVLLIGYIESISFFPFARYIIFILWLHFRNTVTLHLQTSINSTYSDKQQSCKNSTSIDTFTHQEKYQLFVFTWSMATPFHLPCPTSHSPRTFNGTTLVHRISLCTQRQIYDTARDVDVQTSSRLPLAVVSTEVRNNVSLAGVWNQ